MKISIFAGSKLIFKETMNIRKDTKLDFDDVLIVPKPNSLNSRLDVNLQCTFKFHQSNTTWTGIPIISANMTTVSSFDMAKSLSNYQMMTALHKYYSTEELIEFFGSECSNNCWYTIGSNETDLIKLQSVIKEQSINKICIDVANGYRQVFVDYVNKIVKLFQILRLWLEMSLPQNKPMH
jgi:GMP reductase